MQLHNLGENSSRTPAFHGYIPDRAIVDSLLRHAEKAFLAADYAVFAIVGAKLTKGCFGMAFTSHCVRLSLPKIEQAEQYQHLQEP